MIYYLDFWVLIIIQFLEIGTSTYPHDFDRYTTHNVTVTEGRQAILPCHVDSNELQIVWMNPKKIMISEGESRFIDDVRMSIERPFVGDYNLHIREVRYDDRGEYTCAVNSVPVKTTRIRLIVQVPSRFVNDGQRSEVKATEGTTVTLTCNATGIPAPNITWFRRIKENEEEKKEQIGTIGEVLVIHNISRHCGGVYECMAFNGVEPAISKTVKVDVQFKPEIVIRNKRLGQTKDKETMLECIVTASPQADNYWRRGNVEISNNEYGRYRMEVYPDDSYTVTVSLRILNVQDRDFGMYTCVATNALGVATDHMELYEYKEPTLPPTTTTMTSTTRKVIYFQTIPNKNREKNPYGEYEDYNGHPRTEVSGRIGSDNLKGHGERVVSAASIYLIVIFLFIKNIL